MRLQLVVVWSNLSCYLDTDKGGTMLKDILLKDNSYSGLDKRMLHSWCSYLETHEFKEFHKIEISKIELQQNRTLLELFTILEIDPKIHFPLMYINGFKSLSDKLGNLKYINVPDVGLLNIYEILSRGVDL